MKSLKRLHDLVATPAMPRESGPTPALYDYPVARRDRDALTRTNDAARGNPSPPTSWPRAVAAVAIGAVTLTVIVVVEAIDDDSRAAARPPTHAASTPPVPVATRLGTLDDGATWTIEMPAQ